MRICSVAASSGIVVTLKTFCAKAAGVSSRVLESRPAAAAANSLRRGETRWAGLEKAEAAKPKRFDNLDNRPGMASAPQLRKIEAMWQDISIIPEPDARGRALRHFVKRISGVADLRFLDSQGAGKVINAMNAMLKQATAPAKDKTPKSPRKAS